MQGPRHAWSVLLSLSIFLLAGCADAQADRPPTRSWRYAAALLLDDAFPNLVVEIDYAGDYVPSNVALDALRVTLEQETQKHSIVILDPTPVAPFPGEHSDKEARRYHAETRNHGTAQHPWEGDTYFLHILYLNGAMEDTRTLGTFHGTGEITLLSDLFVAALGPYFGELPGDVRKDQVERKALIHELGHGFGLVGCGIPMLRNHVDPGSECHSSNPRSVMSYWNWTRPEDDAVRSVQETLEVPWQFDDDDRADMSSFRAWGTTFFER